MTRTSPKKSRADPATYLVTGANRGIGLELARQLSARGDRVIATARKPVTARPLANLDVHIQKLDVADPRSVAELGQRLEGVPIDVLLHNAGIGTAGPRIDRVDPDDVAQAFRVNALGPLRVTQALLPGLRAGRRKTIVGITSGLGSISENTSGSWSAYRISKAALNQLFRTLAAELRTQGFICALISPGWVQTDMGGSGATLTPRESVAAMLRVLDSLAPDDNGQFFDHRGRRVAW
jgi:NAD(P)-dependent dehydrogenase (short-subunit alcohol dehydrogenase family)